VLGGAGNDTLLARDRAVDTIDCGPGRDTVTADREDRVAFNGERVRRRYGAGARRCLDAAND
jgi:hypothetical protein